MGQALFAVVIQAYLHGASTPIVDNLVKTFGGDTGNTKSEVSPIWTRWSRGSGTAP